MGGEACWQLAIAIKRSTSLRLLRPAGQECALSDLLLIFECVQQICERFDVRFTVAVVDAIVLVREGVPAGVDGDVRWQCSCSGRTLYSLSRRQPCQARSPRSVSVDCVQS